MLLQPTKEITVDFSSYYTPKPKQALAHTETAKYCLFGGALGGGKSWYLCAEAITHAMKWHGARCVIVRKERSVMIETIWITFTQICPPELIAKIDNKRLAVKLINGSEIRFVAVDIAKDPILNKIKGLEISWFGLDEANELDEKVFTMLKTRLRWRLPDGTIPRYEGRLTSNPENCWLIPVFIESDDPQHKYIQSLTSDNYDKDSEYYQILEQAFKNDPILKQKYLLGDWGLIDKINQLIPGQNLINARMPIIDGLGTGLGVDVARFGSDESVWCFLEGGNVKHLEGAKGLTIPQVVDKTKLLIDRFKIDPMSCGVDGVGMGAGVVDYLHAGGYEVVDIVGGAAIDPGIDTGLFKPFNLRSQMFWVLRQDIIEGRIGNLAGDDSEEYKKLQRQLTWIEYVIQGDKTMKVVGKDQIAKVHGGKSPDYPDAIAYANWVKKTRNLYELALPLSGG
jgi:hypothetical protein